MTPLFLNPPPSSFPREEHHLQLFLSPNQASDRLSGSAFFNSTQGDDHQTVLLSKPEEYSQQHHKVNKYINHPGGACSSSSHQSFCKIDEDGSQSSTDYGSSTKWMSSKMRLMRKMMITQMDNKPSKATENVKNHLLHENNNRIIIPSNNNNGSISSSNHVRVCADCNTTTTPLWRSGPRGPKSLCNACGIRQRKARRAMEAAAAAGNSAAVATDAPSMKIKVQNKEKKWRTSHVGQYKKQCKLSDNNSTPPEKLCFKDFALSLSKNSAFGRVFPRDEEEAAILLMELSCGLLHG